VRLVEPCIEKYGEVFFCDCSFWKELVLEIPAGKKQVSNMYIDIGIDVMCEMPNIRTLCKI